MKLIKNISLDMARRNTLALAKTARILNIPVVLTSSQEENLQGPLMPELQQILPEAFAARVKREGSQLLGILFQEVLPPIAWPSSRVLPHAQWRSRHQQPSSDVSATSEIETETLQAQSDMRRWPMFGADLVGCELIVATEHNSRAGNGKTTFRRRVASARRRSWSRLVHAVTAYSAASVQPAGQTVTCRLHTKPLHHKASRGGTYM